VTLRGITFDFWQTLAREPVGTGMHADRIRTWERMLQEAGRPAGFDVIRTALAAAARHREAEWVAGRHHPAADAARAALRDIDAELDHEVAERLVEAFANSGEGIVLELTPNVAATLAELDEAGLRLGIVCDVGFTSGQHLRDVLEREGVLRHFDGWAFSDEVGSPKPGAAIFEHALRELGGLTAAEVAHIGDLRRTDMAGARAMGMTAIRYRGIDDDPPDHGPEGHHVLDDHAGLVALLREHDLLG
jgi:putative hydrolase of the HAD superfamily